MKKCPKCHKNIPSNAKVCPYCGTPQSGYQPMKRTPKRKYAFIYPILIIAFVFLPMGISYFFAFNTLSDSGINQTATLKTYTKSNQETVVYQYDSLKEFSKNVKNSKKYVNKINNMESSLEKIVGTKNMDSEYLFQITNNNNLYVSVQYDISLDKQNTMSISYDYDLSKESQLQFEYHLNDIQQLDDGYQQLNQQVTKINQIITLFNEKDNQELIQKTLNDLKNNEAEITKETLSHYGKGMTQSKGNDQSSIRIFNYKDTYRLKFSYDSNLNLENLYKDQEIGFFFLCKTSIIGIIIGKK